MLNLFLSQSLKTETVGGGDAVPCYLSNTVWCRRDIVCRDEIRDELSDRGIILEDTKDGVRWKRK